jgi:hypothetical protein
MEEMPHKSAAELVAECLRLLAMDPHTRGVRRVEIIRLYPKGTGPNWTYGALDPMPTRACVTIARTPCALATRFPHAEVIALAPDTGFGET